MSSLPPRVEEIIAAEAYSALVDSPANHICQDDLEDLRQEGRLEFLTRLKHIKAADNPEAYCRIVLRHAMVRWVQSELRRSHERLPTEA